VVDPGTMLSALTRSFRRTLEVATPLTDVDVRRLVVVEGVASVGIDDAEVR
jgi:hypothetical protein